MKITHAQIRILKAAQRSLGIDDDTWRELMLTHHVSSCTELDSEVADGLIDRLVAEARKSGKWMKSKHASKTRPKKKYDDLGERLGMATPAQLRLIEVKWREVTRQTSPQKIEEALARFIEKRYQRNQMDQVRMGDVPKIIRALDAMKRQSLSPAPSPPADVV